MKRLYRVIYFVVRPLLNGIATAAEYAIRRRRNKLHAEARDLGITL